MSNKYIMSPEQHQIALKLNQNFGIDIDRILFLNKRDPLDPFIPSDELESIARQSGKIRSSSVIHDKYQPETKQVYYIATVIDEKGAEFIRPGVATVGEHEEIDVDILASGRAISAALRAAGCHPFKSGSVVSLAEVKAGDGFTGQSDAAQRRGELGVIHDLAVRKGLTVFNGSVKNDSRYREELLKNFGSKTAATLSPEERRGVINWLENYQEQKDDFANLPDEIREDALVA